MIIWFAIIYLIIGALCSGYMMFSYWMFSHIEKNKFEKYRLEAAKMISADERNSRDMYQNCKAGLSVFNLLKIALFWPLIPLAFYASRLRNK